MQLPQLSEFFQEKASQLNKDWSVETVAMNIVLAVPDLNQKIRLEIGHFLEAIGIHETSTHGDHTLRINRMDSIKVRPVLDALKQCSVEYNESLIAGVSGLEWFNDYQSKKMLFQYKVGIPVSDRAIAVEAKDIDWEAHSQCRETQELSLAQSRTLLFEMERLADQWVKILGVEDMAVDIGAIKAKCRKVLGEAAELMAALSFTPVYADSYWKEIGPVYKARYQALRAQKGDHPDSDVDEGYGQEVLEAQSPHEFETIEAFLVRNPHGAEQLSRFMESAGREMLDALADAPSVGADSVVNDNLTFLPAMIQSVAEKMAMVQMAHLEAILQETLDGRWRKVEPFESFEGLFEHALVAAMKRRNEQFGV